MFLEVSSPHPQLPGEGGDASSAIPSEIPVQAYRVSSCSGKSIHATLVHYEDADRPLGGRSSPSQDGSGSCEDGLRRLEGSPIRRGHSRPGGVMEAWTRGVVMEESEVGGCRDTFRRSG